MQYINGGSILVKACHYIACFGNYLKLLFLLFGVWFSFLLQNRETVGQEPVPKRQLQVKRGCGALSRQHQEACVTLLPTCLWASAKLKGRVPSSRGAIRSMSAKVMRLERKANVSNNKTQTKI